jgi:hypothetical protein
MRLTVHGWHACERDGHNVLALGLCLIARYPIGDGHALHRDWGRATRPWRRAADVR